MAVDTSRVVEKLSTIEQKVQELVAFKASVEQGIDAGQGQAQVDAFEARLDDILAMFPSESVHGA